MTKGLIVFSDFHLHGFEDFSKREIENVYGKEVVTTDRVLAQLNTIEKVFELSDEYNSNILFCGDFFHARNRITTHIFNAGFNSIYENMKKRPNLKMFMLVGNHDQKDTTDFPEHSLEVFKSIPNVTVMDELEPVVDSSNGLRIFPLPYSDNTSVLKEAIQEYKEEARDDSYYNILAGHLGVEGSLVGKHSHRLEGAFNVNDLYPSSFDYVALGHYHRRQFLGNLTNTFYVGNTIQASFSDEGQDKGVFYLNLEDGGQPEFIAIDNKKFITLTDIDENTQEIVDNNYVRFVLPQDKVQEVETYKSDNDNVRLEVQKEYKTETRIDIDVESDEEQIVGAYAEEFYPEAKNKALEVLKEATYSD